MYRVLRRVPRSPQEQTAGKYTKSDDVLDVINEIGLTEADLSNQYQYTKDIASVDGKLKAVSWQATPGLFAYRRSIAKKVLGTDDPEAVQEKVDRSFSL